MQSTKLTLPYSVLRKNITPSLRVPTALPHAEEHPTRRAGRGGNPWSLPLSERQQLQPQDGSPATFSKLTSITARMQSAFPHEPEDARLTGGTRSLTRRLLGLNIMSSFRKSPQNSELTDGMPSIVQVA